MHSWLVIAFWFGLGIVSLSFEPFFFTSFVVVGLASQKIGHCVVTVVLEIFYISPLHMLIFYFSGKYD